MLLHVSLSDCLKYDFLLPKTQEIEFQDKRVYSFAFETGDSLEQSKKSKLLLLEKANSFQAYIYVFLISCFKYHTHTTYFD